MIWKVWSWGSGFNSDISTQVCPGVGQGEGAVLRQFFIRASFSVALIFCDPFHLAASLSPLFWGGLGFVEPPLCLRDFRTPQSQGSIHASTLGLSLCLQEILFPRAKLPASFPSLPSSPPSCIRFPAGPAQEDVRGCLTSMWVGVCRQDTEVFFVGWSGPVKSWLLHLRFVPI